MQLTIDTHEDPRHLALAVEFLVAIIEDAPADQVDNDGENKLPTLEEAGVALVDKIADELKKDPPGKSEESGSESASASVESAPPPTSVPTSEAPVDQNGVPFNEDLCGKSAEPFYATGKTKGQWKKRRGVEQEEYDAWYARELEAVKNAAPSSSGSIFEDDNTTPPVNTAGAFSAPGDEPAPPPPATAPIPTECGPFMGLVSEKIAAGLITQEQVTAAYATCGLAVTDLFPPKTPEEVAANIQRLHATLFPVA